MTYDPVHDCRYCGAPPTHVVSTKGDRGPACARCAAEALRDFPRPVAVFRIARTAVPA